MGVDRVCRPPISEEDIALFEISEPSPLWKAYEIAFESMFAEPNENTDTRLSRKPECLYRYDDKLNDWSWYVTYRSEDQHVSKKYYAEKQLFRKLFINDGNAIVFFHGHVGVGKSTLITYFFRHYIPYVIELETDRLKHLVPVKISLQFSDVESLEYEWDVRVNDFLYERFSELTERQFIENLARYVIYRNQDIELVYEEGILSPRYSSQKQREYIEDTEKRIKTTLKAIDSTSVIKWFSELKLIPKKSLGMYFNCHVISLLADIYNYEFIFIVDNIDQLPKNIQDKVCELVHRKLDNYKSEKNIRFLVSVRDNFLQPIYTQIIPAAYADQRRMLELSPLPFRKVLEQRKKALFDPYKSLCKGDVKLNETISVNIHDKYIHSIFKLFDNTRELTHLYKISNYNTRTMLDAVKVLLKSPHIDYETIASIMANILDESARAILSKQRMIDVLCRVSNHLVSTTGKAIIPNVFQSTESKHYTSTLARLLILRILDMDSGIWVNELLEILMSLGHRKNSVIESINGLLRAGIIFSNRRIEVEDDPKLRERQKLEQFGKPYLEYLMEKIVPSLRYFQSFAFVTPMKTKYRKLVPIPKKIGSKVETFELRLLCASALYRQLREDMLTMKNFVKGSQKRYELEQLCKDYHFFDIINDIQVALKKDFITLGRKRPDLVDGIEFELLFPIIE